MQQQQPAFQIGNDVASVDAITRDIIFKIFGNFTPWQPAQGILSSKRAEESALSNVTSELMEPWTRSRHYSATGVSGRKYLDFSILLRRATQTIAVVPTEHAFLASDVSCTILNCFETDKTKCEKINYTKVSIQIRSLCSKRMEVSLFTDWSSYRLGTSQGQRSVICKVIDARQK